MNNEESKIRIIADPEVLSKKEIKIRLFMRDMLDAEFVDLDTRRVKRSMSQRSREIIGTADGRKTLSKSDKKFIELGIYEEIGAKERLVHLPKGKYVLVKESTVDKLSTLLSDHAAKVYIFLLNNYRLGNIKKGIPFCFTKAQLCKDVLGLTVQGSNSDSMEDVLTTLVANGLISYSIIKKEGYQGFYRRLNYVSEDFILHDIVKEKIKEMTDGLEECATIEEGLLATGVEQEVFSIGYNPVAGQLKNININLLEDSNLQIQYFSNEAPRKFISLEDSFNYMQKKGKKISQVSELIEGLSKPGSGITNNAIVAYLRQNYLE